VSRSQWIEGERIRRLTGDCPFPPSRFATQPYGSHGSFSWTDSPTRTAYMYSIV
jgi:hypothetical protein